MKTAPIITLDEAQKRGLLKGASCAIGVFDGFHLGHRFIVDCTIKDAADSNSVILTFDIDPDELFRPDKLRKLMTNDERLESLSKSGVDFVVTIPFNRQFASKSPQDFMDEIFGENTPASLHVGADFRFGHNAAGTANDLASWGKPKKMRVVAHKLYNVDGAPVTASRIRNLLANGQTSKAKALLSR